MKVSLLSARQIMGLSQNKVSKLSGVSQPVVSRIEDGKECKLILFYKDWIKMYFNNWKQKEIDKLEQRISDLSILEVE